MYLGLVVKLATWYNGFIEFLCIWRKQMRKKTTFKGTYDQRQFYVWRGYDQ